MKTPNEPPEFPQSWGHRSKQPVVSEAVASAHVTTDVKAILDGKFKSGEGVVTIGRDTPDEAILAAIRYASSFGKPFTVLPSVEVPAAGIRLP
ncbi:hypothetical protein [Paraburkholderia sp. J8-2]|uniref:hypothetical protein n=1 Tax=Paraburkholderia sp. J8-2 TaxID=2805440 RepID=UPI002AB67835|nr:hypothetical protein [Paraburkholderia sp. J8-2]